MVRSARAGFTLVEVIVCLVLLAVALLGLAAAGTYATASLHRSLREERVVRQAAALLDSLTFTRQPGPGSLLLDGVDYRWSVAGASGAIRLSASLPGPRPFVLELTARHIGVPAGGEP